jgi:hypothetical protein
MPTIPIPPEAIESDEAWLMLLRDSLEKAHTRRAREESGHTDDDES